MKNELLDMLLSALLPLAQLCEGYAMLVDREGKHIKTMDSNGEVQAGLVPIILPNDQHFWEDNKPVIVDYEIEEGAKQIFLPVGDYILVLNNELRIREENNLKKELNNVLPMIAKIVGGHAVLYDKTGLRTNAYGPDGNLVTQIIGDVSMKAELSMKHKKPVYGPSAEQIGATGINIPITSRIGLGFNNVLSVKQKRKLINSVRDNNKAHYIFDDIIGSSSAMQKVKREAESFAKSNSSVFLFGESGTGKELFAQSIHNASLRSGKPFVAINCGAVPISLVESTFFGYEKGAFTGANSNGQKGIFELANGGTIFLDEISEMELGLQTRLLRVLQEREVMRVGGQQSIPLDIRVISSSNRNIMQMIDEGKFREDLYYRLNIIELTIPPLRERKEDIYPLLTFFIQTFNDIFGKRVEIINDDALDQLKAYDWPGNVRELRNYVERIMNVVKGNEISMNDLPLPFNRKANTYEEVQFNRPTEDKEPGSTLEEAISDITKANLLAALKSANNNRQQAAKNLGISTTTLWRKMKKYNLI